MRQKHAEIAGAGFAGLSLGIMLARAGWTVRVHERERVVREIGAGIFIRNNGLLVLEDLDLMVSLSRGGIQLLRDRMVDERGRVLQARELTGSSRTWTFPRQALIDGLRDAAEREGVEIRTDSMIAAADPDGVLVSASGTTFPCDLAVAADGHRSVVRESLGLTGVHKRLSTTSIRYLLDGRELTPEPMTNEHWSARRRIAVAAAGPDHTYIYMAAPAGDELGSAVPIDQKSWSKHFPHLREVFARLIHEEPYRTSYELVKCSAWSRGSVAVLGDAAHALPPTLGQGTNLALSNARSLVAFLGQIEDVPNALRQWEPAVRPITDLTQRWARYYDWATKYWPRSLSSVRRGVIWTFGASPVLNRRLRTADNSAPILGDPLTSPLSP